jgi:hypothetical protein
MKTFIYRSRNKETRALDSPKTCPLCYVSAGVYIEENAQTGTNGKFIYDWNSR